MLIGLQLYSIREFITADNIDETLAKVRATGFNAVEFAGYYGLSAADLKAKCAANGLEAYSAHVPYSDLQDKLEEVVEYAADLGLSWVICPWASVSTMEEIKELAGVLKKTARALAPRGIKAAYHNHSHEFAELDGKYALDHLRDMLADEAVYFEIDCCWAQYAGVEPACYLDDPEFKQAPVHFKDLNANYKEIKPQEINAVVGQGIVDFKAVLASMKKHGRLDRGVIVEQEGFVGDPWEELASAVKWIQANQPE